MDESTDPLTIGQLARRTGLDARTLRFWSDEGVVPPVTRSPSGYRLYDAGSVARVELVRTLRELGLGLEDVRRVLDGRATVAEVADTHVAAIDAQIRSLKVSRAVLSTVSKRGSTAEETTLMNRLARLSAAERARIVEDFKADVYGRLTVDPSLRDRIRDLRIDLPDDPTPDQVDAWIELAELVGDPDFRARIRAFFELTTPLPGGGRQPGARIWWARQIVNEVAELRESGVDPSTPAAAELAAGKFRNEDLAAVRKCLRAGMEANADRYRILVARVRGHRTAPDGTPELQWLATALETAGDRLPAHDSNGTQ
jgi:DNA-binding transcriptional MerR regulator